MGKENFFFSYIYTTKQQQSKCTLL